MLLNLLTVLVSPFTIGVVGVKVILIWGFERGRNPLPKKVVPWEVSEPRMVFNIFWPVETKSIQRFSLDKPIDKISSLYRPAFWDLYPLDLNLFRENMLSDLLPSPPSIRPPSKHAFIANDTHGKVVNSDSVWLLTYDFGSHVPRSPRGVLRVVWVPYTGNTQVSDFQVAIFVKY